MLRTLAGARRVAPWALFALVTTALPFARADCPTLATPNYLLYKDAHFSVYAYPAPVVNVDLSTSYPPPPSEKPPYVYGTNFHPAVGEQADSPLTVQVCPVGVASVWNLRLSVDDLVDRVTNQTISANKVFYTKNMLATWIQLNNNPWVIATGSGDTVVTLKLYFQIHLDGSEQSGAYAGALHFDIFAP